MPVRIFDISKKLGLENRTVLEMARDLGITAAKVPSSSLDKVTAEYLESHLHGVHPAHTVSTPRDIAETNKLPVAKALTADEALAIRLSSDTNVEIYNFIEGTFQHVGSFAFKVSDTSNREPEELILLANNESVLMEFKTSARWDIYQQRHNPDLQRSICKTVAAFLNTEGGTLLIGVGDNGKVHGLHDDYQTFQRKNRDQFEQFLNSLIMDSVGHELSPCIEIRVSRAGSKEICCVSVRRAPKPVFIKEAENEVFYIRVGNSSRPQPTKAAVEYCRVRWPANSV